MASTAPGPSDPSPSSTTAAAPETSLANGSVTSTPEKPPDDSSKLRMFLGILRKFIGVSDIANVRFSLPAQLLEPTPNLEYWNYLDQPSTFVAIGDSNDPLDRMLEVLRFWFTKDLKYVKGRPCKPYNSTLGEFFRCNWDVEDQLPPINTSALSTPPQSSNSSLKSARNSLIGSRTSTPVPGTPLQLAEPTKLAKPIRVSYLTEQTSHHPPVSAFFADCPEKGITAKGFDQISVKFTGTSVRVAPGEHNLGIFITLQKRDNEQYQLTHPAANLGGLLRGGLNVTVGDICYVTCPKSKIKTILHYHEEGWIGKTQNKVEGVIFRYDPENDVHTRVRDVPTKDILARISGNWKDKLYFTLGPKSETSVLLIDLNPLSVAPKLLPPETQQLPNESLKFWSSVTNAINSRQYSLATNLKQELEERQRQKAKDREIEGTEWSPRFFADATHQGGKPELTDEGRNVLRGLHEGAFEMKESQITAA